MNPSIEWCIRKSISFVRRSTEVIRLTIARLLLAMGPSSMYAKRRQVTGVASQGTYYRSGYYSSTSSSASASSLYHCVPYDEQKQPASFSAGSGMATTWSASPRKQKSILRKNAMKIGYMYHETDYEFGFEKLGEQIKIKCFTSNPSINSSLKFLRKTPWAREKVENLYVRLKK